jgi:hypothetical protein
MKQLVDQDIAELMIAASQLKDLNLVGCTGLSSGLVQNCAKLLREKEKGKHVQLSRQ